jgi:hypothetical protein
LYASILPWGLSPASIASMAFFQYATTKLRGTLNKTNPNALSETLAAVEKFYETLAYDTATDQGGKGSELYPVSNSHPLGMQLSFR